MMFVSYPAYPLRFPRLAPFGAVHWRLDPHLGPFHLQHRRALAGRGGPWRSFTVPGTMLGDGAKMLGKLWLFTLRGSISRISLSLFLKSVENWKKSVET